MNVARFTIALAAMTALAGCVPPPPPGPTISAVPGQGKDYAAFQRDDYGCQQDASRAVNGVNPGAAATQNGVASAAIGTGLGAAAGALLGAASGHAGAGAAIGAGSGLLLGGAVGAGNAQATGESIQGRYNQVYAQCMIGHGNEVAGPYGRRRWNRGGYYAAPGYYGGPPPGYQDGPGPDGGPPPGYGDGQGPDQGPGPYGGPPPGY